MIRILMKCPKCGEEYGLGTNFCRKCESILEVIESEGTASPAKTSPDATKLPEEDIPDKKVIKKKEEVKEIREEIERSLIKAIIKEILLIKDERDRYNRLLKNLEEKKAKIPEDLYNESKTNYENNLMEIAKRFKELKTTYTGLRERVNIEIQSMERELASIKGQLYDIKRMSESGLISKRNLRIKERKFKEDIKTKERDLKEKIKIQDLLSQKEKFEGVNRRKTVALITIGFLFFILAGFGISKIFFTEPDISPLQTTPSKTQFPKEVPDIKGVEELLGKIKRANLDKDIELFESCYSPDYEGLNKRIEKAIALWKDFDFVHLEYTLKDNLIKENEGIIRVSWDMKVRSRDKGVIKEMKDDLTVFIVKEGDFWKIRRVIKEKV